MLDKFSLKAEQLRKTCSLDQFEFETTEKYKDLEGIIGQDRGVNALDFGLSMDQRGYNIYVAGNSGTGRSTFAYSMAGEYAIKKKPPWDWVYVYNFNDKDTPKALNFKPGMGKVFSEKLKETIKSFRKDIPETFQEIEYETRANDIYKIVNQKRVDIIKELNEKAKEYGFVYTPTDQGLLSVPIKDGKPISREDYQNISVKEKEEIMAKYNDLNLATHEYFNRLRSLEEDFAKQIKNLEKNMVYDIVHYDIEKLIDEFGDKPKVKVYLQDLEEDIMKNIDEFKAKEDSKPSLFNLGGGGQNTDFFIRYKTNFFVDNSKLDHAPIISESNPIFNNLIGTIEYKSQMGVLTTDFTKIKAGTLHLANGGYLIFQAKEILSNPMSWEIIKRTLKTNQINIENYSKLMGYAVTSSLKPEPIPLDIKIILIGDYQIYSILYQYDEDFRKLFKVMSDFDIEMKRDDSNIQGMIKFIANQCRDNNLRHFHKSAVGRIVEYSSRLSQNQEKLSTEFNKIVEIIYEADLWAGKENHDIVREDHVEKAILEKQYRSNKYEEKLNEMFLQGDLLIDTQGDKVGQINGLAVLASGEYAFGKVSRITASVYSGEDGIINIERESKQSGKLHDKGVLILEGYLGERYASERPLSLTIGIGFEQNYSFIDGDSASSTELYAILSSMGDIPIKQNIAVTGSVNQKGEIQPIGGVNEKIEGFYNICKFKGLTGDQGVMIPKQNIKNLMLNKEVIQAVKDGKFHIYAVSNIEEGIEILTGQDMEAIDDKIKRKLNHLYEINKED